jgi:hypothetical protein
MASIVSSQTGRDTGKVSGPMGTSSTKVIISGIFIIATIFICGVTYEELVMELILLFYAVALRLRYFDRPDRGQATLLREIGETHTLHVPPKRTGEFNLNKVSRRNVRANSTREKFPAKTSSFGGKRQNHPSPCISMHLHASPLHAHTFSPLHSSLVSI